MDGNLTKDVLAVHFHEKTGLPIKDSRIIVETLIEEIKSKLERGDEVKISGFGKWSVKEKRQRPGRNPHSGEEIEIAARRVVAFHASDLVREKIMDAHSRK